LLSFPLGTEMFQFPRFAPQPLCIQGWVSHIGMGCPIRRSRDQCLFTGSLGLIAGYRVLLRLSTPRHPPCALMARSHQPDAANRPFHATPSGRLPGHPRRHDLTRGRAGWLTVSAFLSALNCFRCLQHRLRPPARPPGGNQTDRSRAPPPRHDWGRTAADGADVIVSGCQRSPCRSREFRFRLPPPLVGFLGLLGSGLSAKVAGVL
jgi:hypothetical protein